MHCLARGLYSMLLSRQLGQIYIVRVKAIDYLFHELY